MMTTEGAAAAAEGSLPTWTQRQSLTQVLPLTPTRATYAHHEKADPAAVYAMATFQRFLSSSWADTPSDSTATPTSSSSSASSFPASIVMYNATTRWIFAPASRADLVTWRQQRTAAPRPHATVTATGGAASVAATTAGDDDERGAALGPRISISSFVRRLFGRGRDASSSSSSLSASSASSQSSRASHGWSMGPTGHSVADDRDRDEFLWTKVQVSVDIRVPPSMYRYYIASVVLGDTKRLVETWKTTVDEYFLRDETTATDPSMASGSSGGISGGSSSGGGRRAPHARAVASDNEGSAAVVGAGGRNGSAT